MQLMTDAAICGGLCNYLVLQFQAPQVFLLLIDPPAPWWETMHLMLSAAKRGSDSVTS